MKSHSDEHPHKCNMCGRNFKTLNYLQNHINTHSGIKPHMCQSCPSAFTSSGLQFYNPLELLLFVFCDLWFLYIIIII